MPITVTRNFGPLDEIALVTRADMEQVGLLARELIVRRTLGGLDAEGVPFAPYSDRYAAEKAAELGVSHVNLQVSGNMLNHLQVIDVDDASVTLGWLQ